MKIFNIKEAKRVEEIADYVGDLVDAKSELVYRGSIFPTFLNQLNAKVDNLKQIAKMYERVKHEKNISTALDTLDSAISRIEALKFEDNLTDSELRYSLGGIKKFLMFFVNNIDAELIYEVEDNSGSSTAIIRSLKDNIRMVNGIKANSGVGNLKSYIFKLRQDATKEGVIKGIGMLMQDLERNEEQKNYYRKLTTLKARVEEWLENDMEGHADENVFNKLRATYIKQIDNLIEGLRIESHEEAEGDEILQMLSTYMANMDSKFSELFQLILHNKEEIENKIANQSINETSLNQALDKLVNTIEEMKSIMSPQDALKIVELPQKIKNITEVQEKLKFIFPIIPMFLQYEQEWIRKKKI